MILPFLVFSPASGQNVLRTLRARQNVLQTLRAGQHVLQTLWAARDLVLWAAIFAGFLGKILIRVLRVNVHPLRSVLWTLQTLWAVHRLLCRVLYAIVRVQTLSG